MAGVSSASRRTDYSSRLNPSKVLSGAAWMALSLFPARWPSQATASGAETGCLGRDSIGNRPAAAKDPDIDRDRAEVGDGRRAEVANGRRVCLQP